MSDEAKSKRRASKLFMLDIVGVQHCTNVRTSVGKKTVRLSSSWRLLDGRWEIKE